MYTRDNEQAKMDLIENLEEILELAIVPYYSAEDEMRMRQDDPFLAKIDTTAKKLQIAGQRTNGSP